MEFDNRDEVLRSDERTFTDRFIEPVVNGLLPVWALTYLICIFAYSWMKYGEDKLVWAVLHYSGAHYKAFITLLWVSVPACLYILMMGTLRYPPYARMWYWITSALMVFTLLVTLAIMPDAGQVGRKIIITIPLHFIIYLLVAVWTLPWWASFPLMSTAAAFLAGWLVLT